MSDTDQHHEPAQPNVGRTQEILGRFRARLRPIARQSWLNLKIWVPFLLNPSDRNRQVTYHAREHREGFRWTILLPRQCWQCGTEEQLWDREFEIDRHGFEHAVTIVVASLGCAGFFLLFFIATFRWQLLLFAILSLVMGGAVLWAKSWLETVTITIATCPAHANDLVFPGAVVDQNELHLFMPTERLANATRNALRAERRGRDQGLPGAPRQSESRGDADVDADQHQEPDRYRRPPTPPPSRIQDLPPIKLADDDDASSSSG